MKAVFVITRNVYTFVFEDTSMTFHTINSGFTNGIIESESMVDGCPEIICNHTVINLYLFAPGSLPNSIMILLSDTTRSIIAHTSWLTMREDRTVYGYSFIVLINCDALTLYIPRSNTNYSHTQLHCNVTSIVTNTFPLCATKYKYIS